jgi:hypothetical protein
MMIVLGVYAAGIFFSTSNLDSPNMPPIVIPGLAAEKNTSERALNESHNQYMRAGN